MEALPGYALELERGEKVLSFIIQARYKTIGSLRTWETGSCPGRCAFLQEHHPSVQLGSEPNVIFPANCFDGQKAKSTVSSSGMFGRLPAVPSQGKGG
jgi:hypothetical protein